MPCAKLSSPAPICSATFPRTPKILFSHAPVSADCFLCIRQGETRPACAGQPCSVAAGRAGDFGWRLVAQLLHFTFVHKVTAMSSPVSPLPQKSGTTEFEAKDKWFKIPVSPGLHLLCRIIFCSKSLFSAAFEVICTSEGSARGLSSTAA